VSVALPSDRITLPTGAQLTADESTAFRQQKGQQLRVQLERLITHPNYQRLPDALKVNAIERVKGSSNTNVNARERRRETLQLRQGRREALMQQLGSQP
jgi:hypothetical protein